MNEKEKLKVELDLLLSLNYVSAWTGSLGDLRHGSYVKFSDITKLINEKKSKIQKL